MEVPEKIYVSTDPFGCLHAYDCENHPPIVEEYYHKDAFVEKAVEWIDKNAFRYIVTRKYQGLDVTGLDASLAADFKKALEDIL